MLPKMPSDRRLQKPLLINVAITLASLALGMVLVEIGLRIFWKNPAHYENATPENLFWQQDSLLGWTMVHNARGYFIRPEFSTAISTNSLGLRDDELGSPKPDNEVRVLLLGDSVTAGFEVVRSETHEALLEAQLNAQHDGRVYQVVNAGFRGYGTDQEYLFLQSRGLSLQPDLVVLAVVPANDLEDNVTVHAAGRIYSKPYFEYAADSTLVLRGVPVPSKPDPQPTYSSVAGEPAAPFALQSAPPDGSLRKFLGDHLYLYGFVAQRLKNGGPGLVAALKRIGLLQATTPPDFLDIYRTPLPPTWQRRWQLTLDLILKVKQLCEAKDIPLVIWMFPLKEQVYERDQRIAVEAYGLDRSHYDFTQPQRLLGAFCGKQRILFLTPLARFQQEAARGRRMHFISDNHCNAEGQALIADELFRFFLAHPSLLNSRR